MPYQVVRLSPGALCIDSNILLHVVCGRSRPFADYVNVNYYSTSFSLDDDADKIIRLNGNKIIRVR